MSGNKDLQGVRVLLTGASGLLGHNVLRTLLERGCKVRAVVRKSGAIRSEAIPEGTEVLLETILGDILDFNNLEQWCQGCDAVINCAGTTDMSLLRLEDYLPVNCSLPEAICAVMERNPALRTLVSVSSANTVGNGSPQSPADESAPFAPPYSASLYAQSKAEAEAWLRCWARANTDRRVIIVNPGFIIGAYDYKPSSGQLLLAAYRKPLMAAPPGGKSFVYAYDAAQAIVNALSRGRSGERYLLAGKCLTLKEFYGLQAQLLRYRQLYISLPRRLCVLVGALGDLLRKLGVRTMLSRANVELMCEREHYDNSKAVCELGLPQTPLEDAVIAFWNSWLSRK